jgi:phage shock protein C
MLKHLKGKKLYRSPKDAMVFGICAGLAKYFEVDVVFVRLFTIALAFFSGGWPVISAYFIGLFLMPIDPAQDTVPSSQAPKDVTDSVPEEKMDANQNI